MTTPTQPSSSSRRLFLGGLGAAAVATVVATSPSSAATSATEKPFRARPGGSSTRPNILMILADDLGWEDLSSYGSPHIKTPNVDKLAAQGVRFTNAYSASSTCTPTRIGLYTGRNPGRVEVGIESVEPGTDVGLEPSHPTLASLLRDAGYGTTLMGKWHCGYLPEYGPTKSGWDHFFGNFSGAMEYYSKLQSAGEIDLYEDEVEVDDLRYYTDILTERAVDHVRDGAKQDKPWLLNLNFTTPHWPYIRKGDTKEAARLEEKILSVKTPQQGLATLNHLDGGSLDIYREMVESMDAALGKVLKALEMSGQAKDTIVVFASDNGGDRYSQSYRLAGHKHTLQEGGIRVPTIVRWPSRIDSGQVSHEPITTSDLTATLLSVGGASPDPAYPLDGIDLSPYLLQGKKIPERDLFWRIDGERALRRGKWKYFRADRTAKHQLWTRQDLLFDLENDPTEWADVSYAHEALMEDMRAAWEKVDATLLPYS